MSRKPRFVSVHTLLSVMLCLYAACTTHHEAGVACPTIEMSAVANTPTDSTKTVALNDSATIQISRTPLVTTADITEATASQAGSAWALNVTVTDAAAKRVQDFSAHHVGTNMAFAVDGKVRDGTPRITGPITGNKYRIDGLSRADAERLATAISNGCRR